MRRGSRVAREDTALAILFLVWGAAVVLFTVAGRFYARIPGEIRPLRCMFKEITGYPCATCGGTTRTFILLGRGDIVGAIRMNPFMFFTSITGIVLALSTLGAYLGLWPFPNFKIRQPWKRILATGLIIFFLLNWVYLIWSGA
jgi:hypothetical protein